MRIVLIATAWGSGEGGINAFNYSLAIALAQVRRRAIQVYCALSSATDEQVRHAADFGIALIPVASDAASRPTEACGHEVVSWLRERGLEPPDLWIGHDIITGYAAVAATHISGRVALIHHMAYLEYHNARGGVGGRTLDKHEQQRALFSTEGAIIFGVGPALSADAMILGSQSACALVPGFPEPFAKNLSDPRSLRVIVAGRFDAASEALKQSRLAVASFGRAVRNAGDYLQPLESPTMIVLGVAEDRVAEAELEKLAQNAAGRRVNIVPGPFDATPGRLVREMTSSNLAIMPSFHEGFGLVGWEAIGCEVPLILGRETGLFKFIEGLLGGPGIGCLRPQRIRGGSPEEHDEEAMSEAIIDVAKDLDRARRDAAFAVADRERLQLATYCHLAVGRDLATGYVRACGSCTEPTNLGVRSTGKIAPPTFSARSADHFRECSELELSAGQGSSSDRFDVVAELRFGTTPLRVDDMNVDIFVRRASLRVTSEGGKLRGERFGEGRQRVPGVQAMAGGVWVLSDPGGGDMLSGKILGDEVLCRIEASADIPGAARAEVKVAQADLGCDISLPNGQELAVATRKVMEVFLKKAIFKESSGHVILSEAELQGAEAYA